MQTDQNVLCEKINGEKIILRPISESDTERIVQWRNQPEIRKCFLDRRDLTREIHIKWLNEIVKTGRAVQWIICEKETEKPLGTVYLRDIDQTNFKCEFGLYIGELKYQGLGYGKEAVNLVTEYAFRGLKLRKVYSRIMAENARSIANMESAGYCIEGTSHMDRWINGCPIDVVFVAKYSREIDSDG